MEEVQSLRDIEERQRLLKDRIILLGKTLIGERDVLHKSMDEMKKNILLLQTDMERVKEVTKNLTQLTASQARKEEVLILQRQLDVLRHGSN